MDNIAFFDDNYTFFDIISKNNIRKFVKQKVDYIKETLAKDERFQQSLQSLKPQKTIWGFLGVVLFFFVPEIVGIFWGDEIVSYAHSMAITEPSAIIRWLYEMIENSYKDGISYLNITLGFLFLYWMYKSN
jgi:ABC-type transport system involved in cytochrome c biogenesis permease subunit